ncbi:MAG TPA: FAD-dependent oxidoreductase [Pyrinomonadaceae bacterium]|nr:FAD-dependent oxidoreductase [Pyrinomonadaceae bacterium]
MLKPHNENYDVIVAGGGPAGASAAIHLARGGVRVVLIEQKKFPRAKLCGEFISPECQTHFEKLGVAGAMIGSSPALIDETVFYSSKGHYIAVPSKWFSTGRQAYGLSRAVMDEVLLRSAQDNGVVVYENAHITEPIRDGARVAGVRVKIDGGLHDFRAPITIDATGRARILSRKLAHENTKRPGLVAFKAHLDKTKVTPGACEIYFYPGGYGGLSTVESGTSNLCFIIAAEHVKRCNSDPNIVVRECVMKNPRAAETLETADVRSEWLSASWERFGRQHPSPAPGLLAIGDSAAFIDPFTGSGMLMALESGELVAQVILRHQPDRFARLETNYTASYRRAFDSRLRICGLLRRAAFSPRLAELFIAICGASERFRNRLARSTRAHSKSHKFLPHNSLLE